MNILIFRTRHEGRNHRYRRLPSPFSHIHVPKEWNQLPFGVWMQIQPYLPRIRGQAITFGKIRHILVEDDLLIPEGQKPELIFESPHDDPRTPDTEEDTESNSHINSDDEDWVPPEGYSDGEVEAINFPKS